MKNKNLFISLLLSSLFTIQLSACEKHSDQRIIQLINKTSFDIRMMQISPAEKNQWGDNVLENNVFQPDEKKVIRFTLKNPKECKYDIKATKINGDSIIFRDINLCTLLNISLYFEDKNSYVKQNIILENQTGFIFDELYVSESNLDFWSNNLLGSIVLDDRDQTCISFKPSKMNCFYDLRVKRLSGLDVLFRDINMCRTFKITLFWGEGVPYISFWDFR
jgi:hypothetical protein